MTLQKIPLDKKHLAMLREGETFQITLHNGRQFKASLEIAHLPFANILRFKRNERTYFSKDLRELYRLAQ